MKEEYKISVIIPVIGQDKNLASQLEKLLSSDKNLIKEIIISVGDSSSPLLGNISDSRIKIITSPIGRGVQLNNGSAIATGELLLFLHADTILPEDGLEKIVNLMTNLSITGGAFDLSIDSAGIAYRIIEKISSLRSRITKVPFGDQAIFIRREIFEEMSGFVNIPLMEDVELMQRMRRLGHKIPFIRLKVKTSARRWKKNGIVKTTLMNWQIQILFLIGINPERLASIYYGENNIE